MLVGLTGFIGSGKTTVANLLVERHGYRADSFAASVKDALATINGVMAPVKTDGTLPAPGEITLDCESGIAYFNEADVGKSITLNCTRVFFS